MKTSAEILKEEVASYAATLGAVIYGVESFYTDYLSDGEAREDYPNAYSRLNKYFEDVLDVELITSLSGDYRGTIVTLCIGGPGIFLNTREGCIKGVWWGEKAQCPISRDICNAVDDYFSSLR